MIIMFKCAVIILFCDKSVVYLCHVLSCSLLATFYEAALNCCNVLVDATVYGMLNSLFVLNYSNVMLIECPK